MNSRLFTKPVLSALGLILSCNLTIIGQNTASQAVQRSDSLSLKNIIQQVVTSYPTVKIAEEAIKNADSKIALAKTGYNPVADIAASFANLAPVTKLSFPGLGTFQLYPGNNYNAALEVQQLIYDFGRVHQAVALENESKAIGEQSLAQTKQKLSLYAVSNFYSLLYIQAALRIKDEQLATLNEHLNYIEKVQSTGSATEYQVLTTKVRISGVESQKVDLEAALKSQQAALISLLGDNKINNPVVKNELDVEVPVVKEDSLLSFAYKNRDEVLINEKKATLAELRYGMTKLQNKPYLSLQATAGAKNGYLPDLAKFTPNYVIGLGLKVPIFDGMKNKYNLAQAQSAITTASYEADYTKRSVSNEVYDAEAQMYAAKKKVSQSKLQVQQAEKAYALAETSFKAGVITNLDLLDANTSLSESNLMLLKAKIDYAACIYKLKAALGERIY